MIPNTENFPRICQPEKSVRKDYIGWTMIYFLTLCKEITDNSIQLKKDLEMFLYQLRIDAEVHVEEMVSLSFYLERSVQYMYKFKKTLKDAINLAEISTQMASEWQLLVCPFLSLHLWGKGTQKATNDSYLFVPSFPAFMGGKGTQKSMNDSYLFVAFFPCIYRGRVLKRHWVAATCLSLSFPAFIGNWYSKDNEWQLLVCPFLSLHLWGKATQKALSGCYLFVPFFPCIYGGEGHSKVNEWQLLVCRCLSLHL